jgi:hypothetical protein
MNGTVVRLVPKLEPLSKNTRAGVAEPTQSEHAIAACQLALDTLQGYAKSGEATPNKVIVMLASDNADGTSNIAYVTANLAHFAMLGMIDTIKDEIMQSRRYGDG